MPRSRAAGRRNASSSRPDAATLLPVDDVEVVEQRSPARVVVEDRMHEADDADVAILRHDRLAPAIGLAQALGPDDQPIRIDVAVEERVRESAAVVATPTVGVKRGHRLGV